MAVATQSVTTRLPEFQEQYIADLLTSAQNLFKPVSEGGKGLSMPFVQQQLAGLSEGQQQAITSALGGVGAYQPFLAESKEALTSGLGQAQALAAGAGMDPNAYKEYMDPYLDDVVQRAQDDIGRQGQIQQQQASAQAVGSGAFGGSRAAVLQGEIGRNTLEQQARTGERLRSAGLHKPRSWRKTQQRSSFVRHSLLVGWGSHWRVALPVLVSKVSRWLVRTSAHCLASAGCNSSKHNKA